MSTMDAFSGIIGMTILVLMIVLVMFWVIFPWMVYHKLSKIERNTRELANVFAGRPVEVNGHRYDQAREPSRSR